jgi:hypothetical protein
MRIFRRLGFSLFHSQYRSSPLLRQHTNPISMKSDGESDGKPKATEEGEQSEEEQQEEPDASRLALLRNHQLRFSDAFDPNAERVDKIGSNDVIFGRGKGYQNHPGNVRMRDIIEKYKIQYHSLNRKKKRELLQAVYNEIIEDGARFLKKLDGEDAWVKVDADLALQKVSHTLRCRKSVIEKQMPDSAIGDTPISAQGVAHSQMALNGNAPRRILPLGMRSNQLAGQAMSPLATFERQRALASMPMYPSTLSFPPNIDYYNNMARREQLVRETLMLQQMGDTILMNSTSLPRMGLPNRTLEGRSRSCPTDSAADNNATRTQHPKATNEGTKDAES